MAGAVGTANYVVGREAKSVYNEPTAGFLAGRTAPYADALPGPKPLGYPLIADPALAPGAGDNRVQAFNFRLPITRNAANRIPFNKP
ncbi:hypothetical protein ABTM28_20360, partial [Acinetobacter baumannii]